MLGRRPDRVADFSIEHPRSHVAARQARPGRSLAARCEKRHNSVVWMARGAESHEGIAVLCAEYHHSHGNPGRHGGDAPELYQRMLAQLSE